MGHHIDSKGRFQSDKFPDLAPDKIVLSFKDPAARKALRVFAWRTEDEELAEDIHARLNVIRLAERGRGESDEALDIERLFCLSILPEGPDAINRITRRFLGFLERKEEVLAQIAPKSDAPELIEDLKKWLCKASMREKSLMLACLIELIEQDPKLELDESDGED